MSTSVKVKNFIVTPCSVQEIREFVEKWHYSGNINGLKISQCFALYNEEELIGGMIYGSLGMANAWKKYGETENDVIELRRLCCIDNTPKNTESFFIGKTLRWLSQNTDYKIVVSYADMHYGHQGVIYKASNFKHIGMTSKGKIINWNGKEYHDKTIRTYYTNKDGVKNLKPFAQRVKNALENGEAKYQDRPQKHIYIYHLTKSER